ncbi:hypothetical protein, partial [Nonomuraea deserti]|uniref:hypothetical protein n=1 Tax=Nonomuraea deserti TaxID=1848322 RepID=UPI0014053295
PSATPSGAAPETAAELAAALDLALGATPAATFSFTGAFTQSSVSAKASGGVLTRDAPAEDDFRMRVTPFDAPRARYVVAGGDLYDDKPGAPAMSLTDQRPGSAKGYALMVAGMAGPSVIHQLVLHSTEMSRKGRTYSGVLPTARTSGRLRMLLGGWQEGGSDDNSYLEYKLTIDANNRPAKFVLTWKVPVEGSGSYESVFTTTYRGWKETGEIFKP